MDQIEDVDNDIDKYKLAFVAIKFNFNTLRIPLTFLSAIYNGEISISRGKVFSKKIGGKNK